MKYVFQFSWILLFSFLGECLHAALPLPIPASIYGLVLLFLALLTGIVKLQQVSDTAHFLIGIMGVMFVCPAVGLLDCLDLLRQNAAAILTITAVTLVLVFGAAGRVTQYFLKKGGGDHD